MMIGRKILLAVSIVLALQAGLAFSEPPKDEWEIGAKQADDAYWNAFNRADPVVMNSFLSDDVEFYHDRGGSVIGKTALASVNDEMKDSDTKIRREAVPGTVHFFPMRRGDQVYGVLVTGQHKFFATPKGKQEKPAGQAYFTQLMLLHDKKWEVSRIFSYEHVDAASAKLN